MTNVNSRFRRIVLKLSGEAFKGNQSSGISEETIKRICSEIKDIHNLGIEIGIVTGGGNFFRGDRSNNLNLDRASADYMGMLATVINGIALRDMLGKIGLEVKLISALQIESVAETFNRQQVNYYLKKGQIVIFASGTGNPFFSTDTAAALRAIEIGADVFLKATLVDGVYSDDPKKVKNSKKFDRISYDEVVTQKLKVMDRTAVILCQENQLPIKIFNITKEGNILKAVTDDNLGSLVC